MELEYEAGDVVPVTSSIYCVLHDSPDEREHLHTFYVGERFPPCPDCGKKVRYLLPSRFLRDAVAG